MEDDAQVPPLSGESDPLIGKVLNERFRIVECIGAGGMGRVYKAVQMPLERPVAIKILNADFGAGNNPEFQMRFFLEASITAKLQHPNTIKIIDYGRLPGEMLFLAMEYLEGQTLSQVMAKERTLPWPRALLIAQQVGRALREAHRQGVVHRDLKPANVMILHEDSEHDLVKVLDFGLVKVFASAEGQSAGRELTKAGMLLGSPQYMAPEQAKNRADPRSDIYSLGVVLYHLLVGRPPFIGRDSIDIIIKHMKQPVPPFRSVAPGLDIPPEIETMVRKMLEKSPENRFQSMDEVLEAMRGAVGALGFAGVFNDVRSFAGPNPLSGSFSLRGSVSVRSSGSGGEARLARTRSERGPVSGLSRLSSSSRMSRPAPLWRTGVFAVSLVVAAGSLFAFALKYLLRSERQFQVRSLSADEVAALPIVSTTPARDKGAGSPRSEVRPARPYATLHVRSDPPGARVEWNGEDKGETPLELQVVRNHEGLAVGRLALQLSGYQRELVDLREPGDEVEVVRTLAKRRAPRSPRAAPAPPSGYKEDPYE